MANPNIQCPNCGYYKAYKDRPTLLAIVDVLGITEKIKPGDKLICGNCGYKWIYTGESKPKIEP